MAQAAIAVGILPLAVSTDLMLVSFRIIKHINALSSYKTERFHVKEFLNKNYEKITSRLGFIDIKELEYKSDPLTSRLVEKIEKFPSNSKVAKGAIRLVSAITVQFTLVLDILTSPFRYYKHSYYRCPDLIKHIKSERVKYRRLALLVLALGVGTVIFKNLNFMEKPLVNLSRTNGFRIIPSLLNSFLPEDQVNNHFSEKTLMIGGMLIFSIATVFSTVTLKIRDNQYQEARRQLAGREGANQQLRASLGQVRRQLNGTRHELNGTRAGLIIPNDRHLLTELEQNRLDLDTALNELRVIRGEVEIPEYLRINQGEIGECAICLEGLNGKPIVSHIRKDNGWMCVPNMDLNCLQEGIKKGATKKCLICRESLKLDDWVEAIKVPAQRIFQDGILIQEIPSHFAPRPFPAAALVAPAAIP